MPYQKESFQECFEKKFLEFFTTNSILVFSHILELSIAISSYRRVVVRLCLGDQSVVITKVFFLVFEEADLRVRGVSSSSESSV